MQLSRSFAAVRLAGDSNDGSVKMYSPGGTKATEICFELFNVGLQTKLTNYYVHKL